MKYVCINGAPRSGKDSFVECCKQILGERCFNVSSVDFVKHLAYECGWDGTKDLKNRKFLSDLKDLLTQWDDVPYNKIIEAVTNYEKDVTSKNIDAESCVAFSSHGHVFLVSPSGKFPLSFPFIVLTFLMIISQLFYRMFLSFGSLIIFS